MGLHITIILLKEDNYMTLNNNERWVRHLSNVVLDYDSWVNHISTLRADQHYPPTNVYRTADGFIIEMAVAGFKPTQLSVTTDPSQKTITISGNPIDPESTIKHDYVHRGISSRDFTRTWTVGVDSFKVVSSVLEQGILTVTLRVESTPELSHPITVR